MGKVEFKGVRKLNQELAKKGLRYCTRCKKQKKISAFENRGAQCRACRNEYNKEWRKNNPDKAKKHKRDYHKNKSKTIDIYLHSISHYRKRANKLKVPYNLDKQYLLDLWNTQKGCCYYTGVELKILQGKGKPTSDSASLDRLFPSKGYVKGNVVWCSYWANTAKGNLDILNFILMCRTILDIAKFKGIEVISDLHEK